MLGYIAEPSIHIASSKNVSTMFSESHPLNTLGLSNPRVGAQETPRPLPNEIMRGTVVATKYIPALDPYV